MSRIAYTLCLLAIAIGFFILGATAHAATPKQILSDLAANQTHSWIDNGLGFDKLTARYTARVVQVITHQQFDGLNDGHAMIEVAADGRWHLYDVDANVRATDAHGRGMSLLEQMDAVRERRALWEPIASDPLFREDEPDEFLREKVREVFADPESFYERVMGTAFLPADAAGTGNGGLYYIDDSQTERLRAAGLLAGRVLASPATWYNLTGVLVTAPAPVRAIAPAVAVAAPEVALPAPKVKRSCVTQKRRYRTTRTRKALRQYRRCLRR
jgi:hypothetical protein